MYKWNFQANAILKYFTFYVFFKKKIIMNLSGYLVSSKTDILMGYFIEILIYKIK